MKAATNKRQPNDEVHEAGSSQEEQRLPYERPEILKRCEVRRVTLFSGVGVATVGLTATG